MDNWGSKCTIMGVNERPVQLMTVSKEVWHSNHKILKYDGGNDKERSNIS